MLIKTPDFHKLGLIKKHQINKTSQSNFIYEDCFVYDESRFTGSYIENNVDTRVYFESFRV